MIETITAANSWLNGYVWGWPMIVLLLGTGVLLTVANRRRAVPLPRPRCARCSARSPEGPWRRQRLAVPGRGDRARLDGRRRQHRRRRDGASRSAGRARCSGCGSPACSAWHQVRRDRHRAPLPRDRRRRGTMRGGAMYTLKNGLGLPWLGADLRGAGGTRRLRHRQHGAGQLGRRQPAARRSASRPSLTGIVLAVVTAAVILGGIKRIGQFTEIPRAVHGAVLSRRRPGRAGPLRVGRSPRDLSLVFDGASPARRRPAGLPARRSCWRCATASRAGCSPTRPASAARRMVHAAAQTDHPVRQGLYGIFEVFVDTILVCTTTGLVDSGDRHRGPPARPAPRLPAQAFSIGLPGTWGNIVVTTSLVLFAFSTLIGWSYYGETGDRLSVWREAPRCRTTAVAGVHLPRRDRIAAPGVGRRRHAERADGDPQPRSRCWLARPAASPDA